MSYGQPCRRMTGEPLAGPASAYPTFRSPASICFSELNDVFVPGLIGLILPDCASAGPSRASSAAAIVRAAVPRRRRRSWLICSDILPFSLIGFKASKRSASADVCEGLDDFIRGHDCTRVVRDIDVESSVHLPIRVVRGRVADDRDLVAELSGIAN